MGPVGFLGRTEVFHPTKTPVSKIISFINYQFANFETSSQIKLKNFNGSET